jgi:maltose alpha-D-glucosyltransferase/alpha-amylase
MTHPPVAPIPATPFTGPGADDPLWYKDAVIYEVHVRAFTDSNGDGIGDFRGLTSRLDYIHDLGVTALWLLPFYPSPLRDDGYDISDYYSVHPSYGTIDDFRAFLDAAHERGIRVITELVINHTSDQHAWFQRARRAGVGTPERDFYVWSDTPDRYPEVRIIFQDTETSNWAWDPVAKAYYWHRFFSHQPDLNYDNPAVREAVHQTLDFWFGLGVDGLRLDAIPYLYERDGTNGENLPETHEELKVLRRHVDATHPNRMLLAEANQWPEDAVAYFGDGDECHMSFHFPLMPRLFMAIQMENRFPVIDILEQTPPIPENAQWAIFLRNHDELTLEMVTEEERDFMYRTYAEDRRARLNLGIRRRLAPLLRNDRRRIELLNVLLYSLPGTPVIYYGDEIGMGDNIFLGDRNGVRTPMQWTSGRNAGFSDANPQELYFPVIIDPKYHYENVNVEAEQANANSLLWWTKRMIALRKRHQVLGRGSIEFLQPDNARVMAFLRRDEQETLLVVANLSRHSQHVALELTDHDGAEVVELFGRSTFPPIGTEPYHLTLGPHGYYWFSLEPVEETADRTDDLPELHFDGDLQRLVEAPSLPGILLGHVASRSWYFDRYQPVLGTRLDVIHAFDGDSLLAILTIDYPEADAAPYLIPLHVVRDLPPGGVDIPAEAVVARLRDGGGGDALLVDGTHDAAMQHHLLELVRFDGRVGDMVISHPSTEEIEPAPCELVLDSSEGHTILGYGGEYVLKLVRRLESGVHPDVEMRRFLTGHTGFVSFPRIIAVIELRAGDLTVSLGALEPFITNEGTAWDHTTDSLRRFYEAVATLTPEEREAIHEDGARDIVALIDEEPPVAMADLMRSDIAAAAHLGLRTAELHLALAGDVADPGFRPEGFSRLYQRSLYQSLRTQVRTELRTARRREGLPPEIAASVERLLASEDVLLQRLQRVAAEKMDGVRIRCHGDYRLDEVLAAGTDFVIFDFSGDSTKRLSERRIKASPVRDLAEMLRSFDYATQVALDEEVESGAIADENSAVFEAWGRAWYTWVGAAFLRGYCDGGGSRVIPSDRMHLRWLLDGYTIEKAARELMWEIDHRRHLARIPLGALERTLDGDAV